MARHMVKLSTKTHLPIRYGDIVFDVFEDDEKLGRLLISQGAIKWRSHRRHMNRRVAWSKLDDWFLDEGRTVRKRKT